MKKVIDGAESVVVCLPSCNAIGSRLGETERVLPTAEME